ncbi:MAG TPA: SulP family inorganic anion transporter [Acidimicrobiia bacterium]|nr:SulP family inorganic anion transporter [Acidimicrobiia bacterium]
MSVPLFTSLHGYDRKWFRGDLIAGLTVWAVLVPEALAYASIAGVSPVVGLYAAPPALILYAMFGSSKHLVTGPMAATAALSAAAVADLVTDTRDFPAFTAAVALMTGAIALLAGLLRLGFLANFISEPVLKGFIIGLALTIMIGQVPKLFGVEAADGDFFRQLWEFLGNVGDAHGRTTLVGLGSLALVLILRKIAPAIPGSLVAVLLGIALVHLLDLDDKGVAIVGHIDSGLPSFGAPDAIGIHEYFATAAASVGIMLVGFAEGLGAAKTYATRNHYDVDANRELIGLGAANIGAGFSSGMVVNGSLSKTAVNGGAGAQSQLSGLFVAALTVVTLLFLTGLFEDLPEATLAAVVIAALIELVDFPALAELYRLYTRRLGQIYGPAARPDFIAAVAAMFGVLLFDTLPGLFIGIAVSLLLLLYRASKPRVSVLGKVPGANETYADRERHPEYTETPGIATLRVESGLFFANADAVRDAIRTHAADTSTRAIVLDAESIAFIDVTAVRMLRELAEDLATRKIQLVLAHEIGQVRDVMRRESGEESALAVYPTIQAAVDALGAQ